MAFVFSWTGTSLDSEVFSFDLEHEEGGFATLAVEIRNPRQGLLRPGAPLWGTLSKDGAPLFYGRLIGLPEDLNQDVISLSFIARPADYDAQKAALAASLKVLPYFDPVFYDETRRADPDVALEARTSLWHIDRVSHAVTASDIINGEAGTLTFDGDDVFTDSVGLSFRQTPATQISVSASVQWAESATGTVDLSAKIGTIESYTGQGLTDDWPKDGANIGAGWTVERASWERLDGGMVPPKVFAVTTADGSSYGIPLWTVQPTFVARYTAERQRTEAVSFTLAADVQALVSDSSEDDRVTLSLSSGEIDQPIDAAGAMPIGDLRRKSYFTTDRGRQSIEHLMQLARARLLARARAVEVSWQASFDAVAALTLRHSAIIVDPRLPGGQARGKVVGLRLTMDGDSGEAMGTVTIACTIGKGNPLAVVAAADTYAADYATGYTEQSGLVPVPTADAAWQFGAFTIHDDGVSLLDMRPSKVVQSLTISMPANAQGLELIGKDFADLAAALAVLSEKYTEVAIGLKPLTGGPFTTSIPLTTAPLAIPRTIDLEAA